MTPGCIGYMEDLRLGGVAYTGEFYLSSNNHAKSHDTVSLKPGSGHGDRQRAETPKKQEINHLIKIIKAISSIYEVISW